MRELTEVIEKYLKEMYGDVQITATSYKSSYTEGTDFICCIDTTFTIRNRNKISEKNELMEIKCTQDKKGKSKYGRSAIIHNNRTYICDYGMPF